MSRLTKKWSIYKCILCPVAIFGLVIGIFAYSPIVLHSEQTLDPDGDGLTDDQEALYYTNPLSADTDGDSFFDGDEVENGYSPLAAGKVRMSEHDHDSDGLNDEIEGLFGSDRGKIDSDGDGFSDFEEVAHGYSPTDAATSTRYVREIEVDRTSQRLYFVVNNVRLLDFPVSTGNPWTPTPAGEFTIDRMIPNKRYVGVDYDLSNVKWNMRFKPLYYIHAAYWHASFGVRTMSHGCVNMKESDAKILYQYVEPGMAVKIYGTTPPRRVVEV
ncbi:MAG TPA: L,D-transpeptidase family protein [Candidatus Magasanikbacteria bacterium]|nr:L,D-transpeptidase family protein [Candidatus Magasanikbacteria bacterium]